MSAGPSLVERLAEFFRSRPGEWIDARELMAVAGSFAWRTRVSNLRRPPFKMTIENRQHHAQRPDGSTFTISEYLYLPPDIDDARSDPAPAERRFSA